MQTTLKLATLIDQKSGKHFSIETYASSLGRHTGNTVAFANDALVSRQHAVILFVNDKFFIQDLGSRNGTFLNGKRLEPFQLMRLGTGDEINLGFTKIVFIEEAIKDDSQDITGKLEPEQLNDTKQVA